MGDVAMQHTAPASMSSMFWANTMIAIPHPLTLNGLRIPEFQSLIVLASWRSASVENSKYHRQANVRVLILHIGVCDGGGLGSPMTSNLNAISIFCVVKR